MAYNRQRKLSDIFRRITSLKQYKPCDKTAYLTTLPNEIIDRVSSFIDGPDKAVLAVTCSKLYLSLQYELAELPAWEAAECSRRLKRGGYFERLQLPCFSCAEMHQMSNFYSPELNQPLPQCIAKCRMWRCACKSVTAQEIQAASRAIPVDPSSIGDLFNPCESCHENEGLSCGGIVADAPARSTFLIHNIRFQVPHISVDTTVLRKAIAARCKSFELPLCRHVMLSDSRVLDTFDISCHGKGATCPATCQTRHHAGHKKPSTSCPMPGCGLKFGISQEYLGHIDESWRVIITISRKLPGFGEHLKHDRAWSSLAFTNAEMAVALPGMFRKPQSGMDELMALLWSHLVREGSWEYERRMLKHFWKVRGVVWLAEKQRRGKD